MVDSAFVTNPGLFKDKLPYDTRRDFIPVSLLSRTQLVFVRELVLAVQDRAGADRVCQSQSGQVTFASARHRNWHSPRSRTVPAG